MRFYTFIGATFISAAILFSGCANRDTQSIHSGFLDNYSELKEEPKLEATRVKLEADVDFTKYENIYIAPVQIISSIPESKWTPEQKKLFQKISTYLTNAYKTSLNNVDGYRVVEKKDIPKTLVFESAVSAVEVHFDDVQWYQYTPISLGITGISRATYVDGAVRILGEGRFYDSDTDELLLSSMTLQKDQEISTDEDKLVFSDIKPALDELLQRTKKNLEKLSKGVIK